MTKQDRKTLTQLKQEIENLQAFCGVLIPVFEREYKRQGYDFSDKPKARKAGR
jgi:hypothetical protein